LHKQFEFQEETMSKLVIALATATILIIGGAMRCDAATMTDTRSVAPLTKSYTPVEKVGWRRRCYRRGYCGYGYGYGYRPYYGYGYHRPYYGYGYRRYGWRY
jgi:hypothetical protein